MSPNNYDPGRRTGLGGLGLKVVSLESSKTFRDLSQALILTAKDADDPKCHWLSSIRYLKARENHFDRKRQMKRRICSPRVTSKPSSNVADLGSNKHGSEKTSTFKAKEQERSEE